MPRASTQEQAATPNTDYFLLNGKGDSLDWECRTRRVGREESGMDKGGKDQRQQVKGSLETTNKAGTLAGINDAQGPTLKRINTLSTRIPFLCQTFFFFPFAITVSTGLGELPYFDLPSP